MTIIKSPLCEMLGIKYPVIQGGMGPFRTVSLAAAVSNAGGLGTVSVPGFTGYEKAAKTIVEHLHIVKNKTNQNFAVNTPIASEKTSPAEVLETQDAMIRAVVKEKQNDPELRKRLVLCITSGGNPTKHHAMIKNAGFKHFHVTGSASHARLVEKLGLDGVIASGYEMGAHTHLQGRTVHTFVLVPSVVQAVKIPVVASGGICDGPTFVAALAMGAVGVQMGTRFIASRECDFHDNYKQFVVGSGEFGDMVVESFISPFRTLKNPGAYKIIEAQAKLEKGEMSHIEKTKLLDEALQKAEHEGDITDGLVPAGQVAVRIKDIPSVREIIDSIIQGAQKTFLELKEKMEPV